MKLLSDLLSMPAFKGQLLFNAGNKPYVVYRQAARDRKKAPELLRNLFRAAEERLNPMQTAS